MAEGLCRHYKGDSIEAFSAGIETHGMNTSAIKVMNEIGIDISQHHSKTTAAFAEQQFDYVITVCGHANETCPVFPALTSIIHQPFEDPPKLASEASSEEEALCHYRRVRDEIKDYIQTLPEALNQ